MIGYRNFILIWLLLSILLRPAPGNAQAFSCQWVSANDLQQQQLPSDGDKNLNCIPSVSFADYSLMAPFTLYVNFHFYENYSAAEGTAIVDKLLAWLNGHYLPNVAECQTPGPNGETPEHVPDAKFRIKLYSESTNNDDTYGGIWFHQLQDNISSYPYSGKVLQIRLRAGNCHSGGSCTGCDVTLYGFTPGSYCSDIDNHSAFSSSAKGILHEIGHHLSLDHTNWCDNQCNTVDVDPVAECATPCPASGVLCDNTFTTNPGVAYCPDNMTTQSICSWSTSNNIMTQGVNQKCLTPCQWETFFNRVAQQSYNRIYSWANNCTEKAKTHYLAKGSNIVWQNLMLLNRDIVVTPGSTLTIECEVKMSEGRKFIVQRGGKLIINGGKITNLCPGTRWNGIYVNGNGDRAQPDVFGSQNEEDAGILIVQNGATIERATTAIRTRREGNYDGFDYFGGVVYAEDSDFLNNGRVAEFMKYDYPNKSRFINCTIDKTNDWPIDATGVTIWGCHEITFSGNTFSRLDGTGIYGIHYGAHVVNGNRFNNCYRGIELFSTTPGISWLNLTGNNDFQNNSAHVIANDVAARTGLRISGNTFGPSTIGVWLEGESYFQINNNTFTDTYYGVVTIESGTPANFVSYNTFSRNYNGITVSGNNRNTAFLNNCFDNTTSGDLVLELPLMGETTEIRPVQGQGEAPAANCFNETTSSIDISASAEWSTQFRYLVPEDLNTATCFLPTDNLSDGGVNNYKLIKVDGHLIACAEAAPLPQPEPLTQVALNHKEQILLQTRQTWQREPDNIDKEVAYYRAFDNFENFQARLIAHWYQNGAYLKINDLLALDDSKVGKQQHIGFHFSRNKLNAAAELLDNYPIHNANDQRYVDVQNIYLQYLRAPATFRLTDQQYQYLHATAFDQSLPYRSQAAALLSYLSGVPFVVSLPGENTPPPALPRVPLPKEPAAGYKVYPNPSSGELNIILPEQQGDRLTPFVCRLYNTQGQQVFQQVLENSSKTILSLPSHLTGVFWLEINDTGQRLHQERVVLLK